MKNELYELYKQCFPTSQLSKEIFLDVVDYDKSNIILAQEHCHIVGVSIVDKNVIRFMCVDPQMQNRGFGKELLKRSEDAILSDGYEEAIICKSDIVLDNKNVDELLTAEFFIKHGYEKHTDDLSIWRSKKLVN